jgi:hypothetical protein
MLPSHDVLNVQLFHPVREWAVPVRKGIVLAGESRSDHRARRTVAMTNGVPLQGSTPLVGAISHEEPALAVNRNRDPKLFAESQLAQGEGRAPAARSAYVISG